MDKNKGFSDFGKNFQDTLVKSIVLDKGFCGRIQEVLEINYFEYKHHQVFVKKIFEHIEKYNQHPSISNLKTIVKTELNDVPEVLRNKVQDFVEESFGKDFLLSDDATFVKDKSIDFCKKQKLYVAMEKSIELLNQASFDEISKVINDALKLGVDNNFGYDYKIDFEERFKKIYRFATTTGWDLIDGITKGGLGRGELAVVVAAAGSGKSMLLVHHGSQALKEGKNVVHYTLELSERYVAQRYDSCLTDIKLDELVNFKEQIYSAVVEDLPGDLLIKEYPTKTASTRTIRNHLDRLIQQGKKVDMIIVDYGDLLKPMSSYKEKRDNLESVYEDLRAIAQEYECPVLTASQTNRSGLNAEIITMESISEAFNKCFVADFIYSLSRTIEDKATNQGRIFIAKNRNGPDGLVFPIFIDTSRVKIDIIKRLSEEEQKNFFEQPTQEEIENKIKKKVRERLKLKKKNGDNKK